MPRAILEIPFLFSRLVSTTIITKKIKSAYNGKLLLKPAGIYGDTNANMDQIIGTWNIPIRIPIIISPVFPDLFFGG